MPTWRLKVRINCFRVKISIFTCLYLNTLFIIVFILITVASAQERLGLEVSDVEVSEDVDTVSFDYILVLFHGLTFSVSFIYVFLVKYPEHGLTLKICEVMKYY